MDGKKAYILPLVAAVVLLAWWIAGPDLDGASSDGAVAPSGLESTVDAQIGEAVAACRTAHGDGALRSVEVVVGGPEGGRAVVEQLIFEPSALSPEMRRCLLDQVGAELSAPTPAQPLRRAIPLAR